ncbi:MAG: hypothetical protein AAF555_07925 [Verrucomicrobiota bacterium]
MTVYLILLGLVLAGGVYGWLQTSSQHKEAQELYERELSSKTRLERGKPFPNQENLDEMEESAQEYAKVVEELKAVVSDYQPPVYDVLLSQFQSRLRGLVEGSVAELEAAGVSLEEVESFYYGMDKYQSVAPTQEAVPFLLYQAEAIQEVLATLAGNQISELLSFSREEIPPEKGRGFGEAPQYGDEDFDERALPSEDTISQSMPFQMAFQGSEAALQGVLNDLASSPNYFFVVRALRIENAEKEGPKTEDAKLSTREGEDRRGKILLGNEEVIASLLIDLVFFPEEETSEN